MKQRAYESQYSHFISIYIQSNGGSKHCSSEESCSLYTYLYQCLTLHLWFSYSGLGIFHSPVITIKRNIQTLNSKTNSQDIKQTISSYTFRFSYVTHIYSVEVDAPVRSSSGGYKPVAVFAGWRQGWFRSWSQMTDHISYFLFVMQTVELKKQGNRKNIGKKR